MRQAPQNDYRVIVGLCALTATAVAPFLVYHLLSAAWVMAGITGFIEAFTLFAAAWMYRNRASEILVDRMGKAIVLAANITVMLSIGAERQNTIYWLYPLIFINFYLLPLRWAAGLNIGICSVSLWLVSGAVPDSQLARLVGSVPLCIFFGLVFSESVRRQRRALHHLANHDALTGVGNRLALDAALDDAAERLGRYGETTTLVLLDIDRFKAVNDSQGHLKGDEIIVEFARVLDTRLRRTDRLFRYGGEEFVILLPHTSLSEAFHVAESLRMTVERREFPHGQRMTTSGGLAELAAGEAPDACLDRADRALYEAKQTGRNRMAKARPAQSVS